MNPTQNKGEFNYEVVNSYGVINTSSNGWTLEMKQISWNGRPAKFDIRPWSPEGDRMGKGLSLHKDELIKLRDYLNTACLESL